jgi:hypothetical protein
MDNLNVNKLLETFKQNYFILVGLTLIEILAFILAIVFVRKYRIGRYFIFYIGFDLAILFVDFYLVMNESIAQVAKEKFYVIANTTVSLVELITYYQFFKEILSGASIKNLLRILQFLYLALIGIYFFTKFAFLTERFDYISYILSAVEFLFLIPPCILLFQQLLNQESQLKLFDRPSFWISTGILFYSFISIPYYLLKKYFDLVQFDLRFIIGGVLFYLPFAINFLFLIRAFICKRLLTI